MSEMNPNFSVAFKDGRIPFTQIPNWLLECGRWPKALRPTHAQLLILLDLYKYARNSGRCFPSYNTLAADVGITKDAAMNAILRLTQLGLVEKVPRQRSDRGYDTNIYLIYTELPEHIGRAIRGGSDNRDGVGMSTAQMDNVPAGATTTYSAALNDANEAELTPTPPIPQPLPDGHATATQMVDAPQGYAPADGCLTPVLMVVAPPKEYTLNNNQITKQNNNNNNMAGCCRCCGSKLTGDYLINQSPSHSPHPSAGEPTNPRYLLAEGRLRTLYNIPATRTPSTDTRALLQEMASRCSDEQIALIFAAAERETDRAAGRPPNQQYLRSTMNNILAGSTPPRRDTASRTPPLTTDPTARPQSRWQADVINYRDIVEGRIPIPARLAPMPPLEDVADELDPARLPAAERADDAYLAPVQDDADLAALAQDAYPALMRNDVDLADTITPLHIVAAHSASLAAAPCPQEPDATNPSHPLARKGELPHDQSATAEAADTYSPYRRPHRPFSFRAAIRAAASPPPAA